MLKVTVRNRGEIAVFRCMGRMVAGEDARVLWDGVRHAAGKRLVVLDLAEVDAIDAAGLGLLVFLHTSASIDGMELKLINPTQRVRNLLALTNLDSVLEICSPQDVEWRLSGVEHAHAAEVEANLYSRSIGTCRPFRQDDGLLGSDPLG
jgi:anti-anti-sigma factor